MFLLFALAIAQDSHLVATYFKGFDKSCAATHCGAPLEGCSGDEQDCANRLTCVKENSDISSCFQQLKWSDLDDSEIKVMDCVHEHSCMADPEDHMSFLQFLEAEKHHRDFPVTGASLLEENSEMSEARAEKIAMKVIAQHMNYMAALDAMVKKVQKSMDYIKADRSLTEKQQDSLLDVLEHKLHSLKHVAKSTLETIQMGFGGQPAGEHSGDVTDLSKLAERLDMLPGETPDNAENVPNTRSESSSDAALEEDGFRNAHLAIARPANRPYEHLRMTVK